MNRFVISTVFCAVALISGTGNAASADEPEPEGLHIEAQPLSSALREFSEQTGLQIGYAAELASGKETQGVIGVDNPAIALDALLASTGLEHRFVNAETVVIRTSAASLAETEGSSDSGNSRPASNQVLMAQNQTPAEENQTASTKSDDDEEEELELEKIVVIGTHIRGIAPESSPVRVFTRQDIQNTGVSTVQDFIETLPANFGGGATPRGPIRTDLESLNNVTFGSSVNLRGLGAGSTLALLNGHRLAPSSSTGSFVDISMIPASAIERVEILTDGASSIYGADAVAGVTNFVLRDDFDGVETSLRYGTVTEGDLDEYRASITGGKSWNTGNALIVYEYFNQDNLSAGDRAFSQGAPLPNDVLPSQERHSVFASTSQNLSATVEVYADILFSTRDSVKEQTDFRNREFTALKSSDNLSIAAGSSWKISDTWFADFGGTYSSLNSEDEVIGADARLNDLDSSIWTGDAKISGTVLNLPGGDLKLAVGGQFRREEFTFFRMDDVVQGEITREAVRDVYAIFGEVNIPIVGPDNAMPGIHRLEVNASGRYEDFSDFGTSTNPKVGLLWSPIESVRLRGSYSTSFKPPSLGRVGAIDRAASVLQTSFINGVFGFAPGDPSIADVAVITVFGTDNELDAEQSRAITAGLDFEERWDRHHFDLSATWFDIDFDGRLGSTPTPDGSSDFNAPNIAFNNPDLFPPGTVIFFPSQNQLTSLFESLEQPLINFFGLDPFAAEIINFTPVVRNLAGTFVRGVDVDTAYSFHSDIGVFSLTLDASYLSEFKRQRRQFHQ